jgi:hypothetical protein
MSSWPLLNCLDPALACRGLSLRRGFFPRRSWGNVPGSRRNSSPPSWLVCLSASFSGGPPVRLFSVSASRAALSTRVLLFLGPIQLRISTTGLAGDPKSIIRAMAISLFLIGSVAPLSPRSSRASPESARLRPSTTPDAAHGLL